MKPLDLMSSENGSLNLLADFCPAGYRPVGGDSKIPRVKPGENRTGKTRAPEGRSIRSPTQRIRAMDGIRKTVNSDSDKYPLLIHPPQNEPVRHHRQGAEEERLERGAKHIQETHAEVNAKALLDELFPQMRDQIGGN